jgi:DNA (cytosine-5)-methyltransferase 1
LNKLTVGSLFAGSGGFDLAAERAGLEVKWQVEIDDYATRVLEKHWPGAKRYRDVREVGRSNLAAVDVICGGFPCQDISYAGDGAGLAGARSGLWYEFARVISEMGPRFVVVENVSALLDRGMGDVLGTLADLGYDAEWHCIPASAFGAPHRRERVWIVAHANSDGCGFVFQPEGWLSTVQTPFLWQSFRAVDVQAWLETYCGLRRNADGVSEDAYRLAGLGNSVVPQVAEWIFRRIVEAEQASRRGFRRHE